MSEISEVLATCPFCGADVMGAEQGHKDNCYFFVIDKIAKRKTDNLTDRDFLELNMAWNSRATPIPEIIEQVRAIKTPKPFCLDQYIKNEVVERVIAILERYL